MCSIKPTSPTGASQAPRAFSLALLRASSAGMSNADHAAVSRRRPATSPSAAASTRPSPRPAPRPTDPYTMDDELPSEEMALGFVAGVRMRTRVLLFPSEMDQTFQWQETINY